MLDECPYILDALSCPLLLLLLQSLVVDCCRASGDEGDGRGVTPTMQLNFHPTTCQADFGEYTPREPRPGLDSAENGDSPWAETPPY